MVNDEKIKSLEDRILELESIIKNQNKKFEDIPIGYQSLDSNGCLREVNNRWLKTLEYESRDEVIGKWFGDFLVNDDKKIFDDNFHNLKKTGMEGEVDFRVKKKNGNIINISFKTVESVDENNNLMHSHCVLTDITDRKKLEEQLFQLQKMEAVGALASGIAHDFNNILTGIGGMAALGSLEIDNKKKVLGYFNQITEIVKRGANLTSQVLGFARRNDDITIEPVYINKTIEGQLNFFSNTNREITINTSFEPELWNVNGIRNQLEMVFLNMYNNARDAMQDGGELSVLTKNITFDKINKQIALNSGDYVLISISDTGHGVPKDLRLRIFDPFFTTKQKGKGTGMGLAMAYKIVKDHKGIITLYSEIDIGTTFNIYLPKSDSEQERREKLEEKIVKGTGNILIVEDDTDVCNLERDMLSTLGYKVTCACNGIEALEYYKKNKYDLVLLDIIMPQMGGKETLPKLKEINPNAKVIITTGYGESAIIQDLLNNGANGFIQKPYTITNLSQNIANILKSDK